MPFPFAPDQDLAPLSSSLALCGAVAQNLSSVSQGAKSISILRRSLYASRQHYPCSCSCRHVVRLHLLSPTNGDHGCSQPHPLQRNLEGRAGSGLASTTPVGVTFAIYKQQDGGAPVWQETQNVTPDASGQYNVILGSTTATGLPDDLFSQQEQRWLGVQVQGQAEQARVLLVSVPYAFKAHEAETLGGLPASAFVKAPPSSTAIRTTGDGSAVSASAGPAGASGSSKGKGTDGLQSIRPLSAPPFRGQSHTGTRMARYVRRTSFKYLMTGNIRGSA